MEYVGNNETLKLCFALKKAGYQKEAAQDPEAWNASLDSREDGNDGYRWEEHPVYGWYPNPGRKALMAEIKKIIGEETFAAQYGTHETLHQDKEHEGWMVEWMNANQTFVKAEAPTTHNDIPNTVAPGAGSSEESASPEV